MSPWRPVGHEMSERSCCSLGQILGLTVDTLDCGDRSNVSSSESVGGLGEKQQNDACSKQNGGSGGESHGRVLAYV
jgi:hypothetical protein